MAGIHGIYHLDGQSVDPTALARAHRVMAHRGPDGSGLWHDGPIGLGHHMLHTTPASQLEDQPLYDEDRGLALTADVRIDNRDALMAALGRQARSAALVTDGALLLDAYKKWGVDCLEHFLGAFAFSLWDARENRLFCARDHMGFKPFYYCHKPSKLFAFGTEIKALLEYPQVPQAINDARIADYLNRWGGDPETTFFKAIRRLPPAHRLIVQRGQVSIQRYWALDRHRELSYASDADCVEGFREVFAEAVRCRLQSPRKAGVMLSGGLDSSSVACVARGLPESSSPLSTFSAVFPGLPCSEQAACDERPYLDALQAQGGYDQHRISLSETSPLEGIDRALDRLDQPPYINNVYLYNRLHQAGQRQDIGVLLDGAEGDDAVSYGFGYLSELAFRRDWVSFGHVAKELAHRMDVSLMSVLRRYGTCALQKQARDGRWVALAHDAYTVAEQFGRSYADVLWNDAVKPTLREPLRRIWHGLKGRRSTRSTPHTLASRDLMHRTDFQRRRERYENQFALEAFTAREAHWHTLHGGAGDIATILEEVDGMAAMHGIEQRHPFYDVRVLSYCLALPAEQQLRHGWSRSILRRAMRGQLPKAIRTRTDKADLSLNFRRNLARFEDRHLRRLVDDAPRSWNDYVDTDAVRRAYAQGRLIDLWPALVLSRWLQQQADCTRVRRKRIDFESHASALA